MRRKDDYKDFFEFDQQKINLPNDDPVYALKRGWRNSIFQACLPVIHIREESGTIKHDVFCRYLWRYAGLLTLS